MVDSVSFLRVIKSGLRNFVRNVWLSASASMVMTITLVIFAFLFLLFAITNYSINSIQNTVDISVYFKNGLAEPQILQIKSELEENQKIAQVKYVSSLQAFEEFKEKHKNDPLITKALNELNENPLPATLQIKAKELGYYPEISQLLDDKRYESFISEVNFEDNRLIIERLSSVLKFTVTFGVALVIVFSLIAVLVIFNTITLTIYNRREEIEIMRLVGATDWYIRGPFLTESLLYSITATAVVSLLFFPVFTKILPKVALFVNPQLTVFSLNFFNYWYLISLLFTVSIVLSVFSTLLAIRRYLKI